MIADLFATALRDLGLGVVGTAATVAEALALIEKEHKRVDAALIDVNLSGDPVFPVADALIGRRTGFVFLTGYDSGSLTARYSRVTALRKPVASPLLFQAIAAACPPSLPAPDRATSPPSRPAGSATSSSDSWWQSRTAWRSAS